MHTNTLDVTDKNTRAGFRLFDLGAAILFFGALAQQPALHQTASGALNELAALGYQIPNAEKPLRVFPALTEGGFSGHHAGGWRPGIIYLRQSPQGGFGEAVYLRHELFHEASHLSCKKPLPAWAEEAGAMHFSGELSAPENATWPTENELRDFKSRIQQGAPLNATDQSLLRRMLQVAGWPDTPCAISAKFQATLGTAFDTLADSAYLLMNLQSGRVLENHGDMESQAPPGSLLKILYAAALSQANPEMLSAELAASDGERLLQRHQFFQASRYQLLLSAIGKRRWLQDLTSEEDDSPVLLGERNRQGRFPVQATLAELALAMRAALLSEPDYFRGLTGNGSRQDSTLFGQADADKSLLTQMQVMAKTGTVSTADGKPLVGHLLLAWPATHPVFLAIFRQKGNSGADILPTAAQLLKIWRRTYPPKYATARVHLLSLTDRNSWEAQAECPEIKTKQQTFTVCGRFRIVSAAHGSRSERMLRGVLHETGAGPVVLETDLSTYVDAVLAAEAQNLPASAHQAMRAVIAWNAVHGKHRHPESASLCDTTHCMVFMGEHVNGQTHRSGNVDIELLEFLDNLALAAGLNWLPFSAGGDEHWQQRISTAALKATFAEAQILGIRRERRKNGEIFIHLYYPDGEETLACEIFRNTLKLPSCPDTVHRGEAQNWTFQGLGAGHGFGLSVARAKALASSGKNAREILEDAYPDHL